MVGIIHREAHGFHVLGLAAHHIGSDREEGAVRDVGVDGVVGDANDLRQFGDGGEAAYFFLQLAEDFLLAFDASVVAVRERTETIRITFFLFIHTPC